MIDKIKEREKEIKKLFDETKDTIGKINNEQLEHLVQACELDSSDITKEEIFDLIKGISIKLGIPKKYTMKYLDARYADRYETRDDGIYGNEAEFNNEMGHG